MVDRKPITGEDDARVQRALALAADAVGEAVGASGEAYLDHARGTISILRSIDADTTTRIAAALCEPASLLPRESIDREFGADTGRLVEAMRQIRRLHVLRQAGANAQAPKETLRRMLLAMAADIRVVLLRLASRLQTLRFHASIRRPPDPTVSRETLDVLAPLANRIGLWQLKWELEDLAFRFIEPETYRRLARDLEERRTEREAKVAAAVQHLRDALGAVGVPAEVSGRPKHIYSIWNKMRSKQRDFEEISDLRGLRVIVDTVEQCYAALDVVHSTWTPVPDEYDDYISKPKANGYRSLHTVVTAEDGRSLEVQIRTHEMHRFAEYGVASHWRYKERAAGAAGAGSARGEQVFEDRIAWMRELLAWQREVGEALGSGAAPQGKSAATSTLDDRIYVLTPQARVIELPAGATPVDFAYQVHTSLGHRCRGAKVDGQMVPLNTPLRNGQTVEIIAAKETGHEGPSLDWLNPQLGYLHSQRSRAKVRQWFNAREHERDVAAGRERIEKVLQREGRTTLAFEDLARRLGYAEVSAMFVAAAREEIGQRQLEEAIRHEPGRGDGRADATDEFEEPSLAAVIASRRRGQAAAGQGDGVLVVGLDSLLTQLARCCRPVPPDRISGFVTHGRGVSVHRSECSTLAQLARRSPERVIETSWGSPGAAIGDSRPRRYPVDIEVRAGDRTGLLREIVEALARDRVNVIGMQTSTRRQEARMRFTVEVVDAAQLQQTLSAVRGVAGVTSARRG
ncbi:MAG: bifunctional (p)ppGpp synthetase/guanosine-3',5'-bis(diphosphate) 3'-pyrophosphohydrolase [Limnobacter sp.]|nr:bifunctional (p)ppGpp synthetase/guanosine-3',5'-bis(diphosphate) 3'-pyrophosphohydrolase [Limnobacter sp.]